MNFHFLKEHLPASSRAQRVTWASQIINQNLDLKELSSLLKAEEKTANCFAWLLSEIGELSPNYLFNHLPYLLQLSEEIAHFNFQESFANYWRVAGVPEENEAEAIDLSFDWLHSSNITVTIKSRAILVLFELTKKYPELKNELKLCVEAQLNNYTEDFAKRSHRVLDKL